MDVSLILTHRCNLACGYCYAGEHHKTDIDEGVLRRGVELLFSDGAERAQLSFFGGEPFLAFETMQRATLLAEAKAAELGRQLTIQCTTNGSLLKPEHVAFIRAHDVRVTVSIDGVREAHDHNRPCAGGKPSFDQVHGGLRRLLDAGVPCDAMMVITPETASYAYLSCNFLWSEGVQRVRANLALDQGWTDEARRELREQLVSIGWEMLARRLRGEEVWFHPFEAGMRELEVSLSAAPSAPRAKLVVGTSGHLYPCAPMVGEDRDAGPEARLRLGHLDDGPAQILEAVRARGVACEKGKGCQCAAYLETGDRYTPGRVGRWYGQVCREIGRTVAEALARTPTERPKRPRRRGVLLGLAAIVGGAAVAAPLLGPLFRDDAPAPCSLRNQKDFGLSPPGAIAVPEDIMPAGGLMPPEPEVPEPEVIIDGEMPVWEPEPLGDLAEPE
ncbi:MAG: radical SAM protein [Myxococcota bacterium]|nr:radical SAM protein [Myxococcota bacterium]